ncbi:MAG: hypothetical protein NTY90_03345 [Candidatus Micrarchaeota archaeon]|nr:hypothetical protein [Candidatus Micrarchaeota archaeon]
MVYEKRVAFEMAGEEMAALAAVQKQITDLKNAIYYLTEKTGGGGGAPSAGVLAAVEELSAELKQASAMFKAGGGGAPQDLTALGDVSKELKALTDQVGYVARLSSDGFSSLKGVADKISVIPSVQAMNALGAKLDSVAQRAQAQSQPQQNVSEVVKKVDAVADSVGYVARQASDLSKKLGEVSKAVEGVSIKAAAAASPEGADMAASVAAVSSQMGELTLRARAMETTVETQRKQADLLSEALALMSKELNTAITSYAALSKSIEAIPTSQQIERLISSTVKMTEAQEEQEKRLNTMSDSVALALKQFKEAQDMRGIRQVSDQLVKLSSQTIQLAEELHAQRKQGEIMASAMAAVVKELSTLEKTIASMPSYADTEKKIFSKLSQQVGGSK